MVERLSPSNFNLGDLFAGVSPEAMNQLHKNWTQDNSSLSPEQTVEQARQDHKADSEEGENSAQTRPPLSDAQISKAFPPSPR